MKLFDLARELQGWNESFEASEFAQTNTVDKMSAQLVCLTNQQPQLFAHKLIVKEDER